MEGLSCFLSFILLGRSLYWAGTWHVRKGGLLTLGSDSLCASSARSAIYGDMIVSVVARWSVQTAVLGGLEVEGGESLALTVLVRGGGHPGLGRVGSHRTGSCAGAIGEVRSFVLPEVPVSPDTCPLSVLLVAPAESPSPTFHLSVPGADRSSHLVPSFWPACVWDRCPESWLCPCFLAAPAQSQSWLSSLSPHTGCPTTCTCPHLALFCLSLAFAAGRAFPQGQGTVLSGSISGSLCCDFVLGFVTMTFYPDGSIRNWHGIVD